MNEGGTPTFPPDVPEYLRQMAAQIEDGLMDVRTFLVDPSRGGINLELTVYSRDPVPAAVKAPLAYCRRCDMAFCPMHMDSHPDHGNGQVPTIEEAERVGATFCAVCGGVLRAKT